MRVFIIGELADEVGQTAELIKSEFRRSPYTIDDSFLFAGPKEEYETVKMKQLIFSVGLPQDFKAYFSRQVSYSHGNYAYGGDLGSWHLPNEEYLRLNVNGFLSPDEAKRLFGIAGSRPADFLVLPSSNSLYCYPEAEKLVQFPVSGKENTKYSGPLHFSIAPSSMIGIAKDELAIAHLVSQSDHSISFYR
jgi:hypothetical protein